ncbi:MAG TPA: hypothetical protein DD643_03425 [Synechococcus sp. UBA8638]|uniref:hypothetical protein n=1 Tax=Candidatus Synechococcus spongiarum TaxID=431041 RepID=UPI0004702F9F|nr:hypothetical protein [Candidatus Synechococcus spongiarum]HBP53447.1 hypothetical protein [Synechococcus sp. UBA8638]
MVTGFHLGQRPIKPRPYGAPVTCSGILRDAAAAANDRRRQQIAAAPGRPRLFAAPPWVAARLAVKSPAGHR